MTKEFFLEFLPYISTLITGIIVWYRDKIATKLGWKKTSKEVDSITIDNIQKNLDLYQEILDDMDGRYKNRVKEIEQYFEHSISKLQIDLQSLYEFKKKLLKINKEQKQLIISLQKSLTYYKENCKCLEIINAEQVNN
ncbi:MAG: hypothetical protein Q8O62_04445 [Aequorivita sp.]|nr:hypothetical protein [Aequorivita sp.]